MASIAENGEARSDKPMLVQIDDSGIGSPVGGAAIGALDTEHWHVQI